MTTTVSLALLSLLSPAFRAQEAVTPPKPSPAASASEARPDDLKIAGQDVPPPSRRKYVAPQYPEAAAAQGLRGIVILEVVIGHDGKVEEARITRSIPGLDEAALAAVRLWEYEPSKVAGKPVRVRLAQSITFSMRLPDLQRAPGVPELKSGGSPPTPGALTSPEAASVAVLLGGQGEVLEAAVIDGKPGISEGLMRAVKAWRFVLSPGTEPPLFTVRAEWTAGPAPTLTLKALDPRTAATGAALTSAKAQAAPSSATAGTPPVSGDTAPPGPGVDTTTSTSQVDTDVLPARQEPPPKEQGVSTVGDVLLGDNIPDLVKGRRPVWPPLARLGNVLGEVVVRFSVDLAGRVTVHSAEGPELLKASAEQAVGTWTFRRTAVDRVNLVATFKYGTDRSVAQVERVPAS